MNNINLVTWRQRHLDSSNYSSDQYYVSIVKRLYKILVQTDFGKESDLSFSEELAFALTYYFEDIVSGIGVWQAFTTKHKQLYGKYLPFYDLDPDNYYPDEVNLEDISLIIWMYIQKKRENSFINPENPYLLDISSIIFNVLFSEFEKAPMNLALLDCLKTVSSSDDFYLLKTLFNRLATKSFLFVPFIEGRKKNINDMIDSCLGKDLDRESRQYAFETILSFTGKTGPLSLPVKEWLSEMMVMWGLKDESKSVLEIDQRAYTVYLVERYDADNIFLRNPEGESFTVSRDAFYNGCDDSLLQQNKSLICLLVNFQGKWMPNGISTWLRLSTLYEEYVKTQKGNPNTVMGKMRKPELKSPMLYFRDSNEYECWIKANFNCSKDINFPKETKGFEYLAVYLCDKEGAELIPGGAKVIFDKDNPFYDEAEAQANALMLLVDEKSAPTEMLHYIIKHKMLPAAHLNHLQGLKRGQQLVQDNMDFIARFMRNGSY